MSDDNIETLNNNSISINESVEAKRANCRKRLRTLEEYSLIENLKEVDKNSKLSEQLEKLKNCEKTKIKEESELNKIKKDYKELNNNLVNIKKVVSQMKIEKLNLEDDFNEEIETVRKKATDQLKKVNQLMSKHLKEYNSDKLKLYEEITKKKFLIEKSQIEELKEENKRISDLFDKQTKELINVNIEKENLASQNAKLKLDILQAQKTMLRAI
uniref:Uncharacterized protein n=1 Tax=Meloidogyne floridensis TaxID=298350 RepID=A0A915ND55_9BILA